MPVIAWTDFNAAGQTIAKVVITGRKYYGAIAEMQRTGMRAYKDAMKAP
jgi:hypothetical protein